MTDNSSPRVVLFASLGTSGYRVLNYEVQGEGQNTVIQSRYSQIARINDLAINADLDDIVILATDTATETNWITGGGTYQPPETDTPFDIATDGQNYRGLKECIDTELLASQSLPDSLHQTLKQMNLPENINEGASIDEIWGIFKTIQNKVHRGDEIHLDITNGYRSIPVVMLLALDFVAKIKGASLKSISYGAAESTNENQNTPIWDLSAFLEIREWSNAVDAFNRGDPRQFANLGKSIFGNEQVKQDVTQFTSALTRLGNCLVDCDAPGLKSAYLDSCKLSSRLHNRMRNEDKAHYSVFLTVLERIETDLNQFGYESIRNSESMLPMYLGAINWCLNSKLHVQAIIFIREACVRIIYEGSWFSPPTPSLKQADALFGRLVWRINSHPADPAIGTAYGNEHPAIAAQLKTTEQMWVYAASVDNNLKSYFTTCKAIGDARNSIAHAKEGKPNSEKFREFAEQLESWEKIVSIDLHFEGIGCDGS